MMHSFHAKNFRGFRDLKIENLKRVNLIAGMNNVGKTALLEAVFLHLGPDNPELGLRINAMRGLEEFKIDLEETWGNLFYNFDTKTIIELSSQDEKGHARKLMISFSAAPPLRHISSSRNGKGKSSKILGSITTAIDAMELTMQYKEDGGKPNLTHLLIVDDGEKRSFQVKRERRVVSIPGVLLTTRARLLREDAERFSKLEATGRGEQLLSVLQFLEARLRKLTLLVAGTVPVIHGDVGLGRLLPLPLLGEGMARLLSIVLAIANTPNGIVLIDEIETGFHHTVLKKIWKAIGQAARQYNTQIIATTHNRECIQAAHEAFSEMEAYDFALHRLDRIGEEIDVVTYDCESLAAAIRTELEVR